MSTIANLASKASDAHTLTLVWSDTTESLVDPDDWTGPTESVAHLTLTGIIEGEEVEIDCMSVVFASQEEAEGTAVWEAAEDKMLARCGLTREDVTLSTPW